MPDQGRVLVLMFYAALSVAAGGAALAYIVFRFGMPRMLLPQRGPRCTWNGTHVLTAFVMMITVPWVVGMLLSQVGLLRWIYADMPQRFPEEETRSAVTLLWASPWAMIVQILVIVGIIKLTGGANPLYPRRIKADYVAGYLTWLMVTPAVFCVFVLANLIHQKLTGQPPDQHPLTRIAGFAGSTEWYLMAIQAVIVAPIIEELVFRGVLLPWMMTRRMPELKSDNSWAIPPQFRPVMVMLVAVVVTSWMNQEKLMRAVNDADWRMTLAHLMPLLMFAVWFPLYETLPRMSEMRKHMRIRSPHHVRAVVANAALFAAFHAKVWPSPIPLFFLSIGIGYIAARTRSIIGPIVIHSMFNLVSVVFLIIGNLTN